MDHIINVAVSIDEDRIKEQIEISAEKQIVNNLNKIYFDGTYSKRPTVELKALMEKHIKEILVENKDIIVESAIDRVASSIRNSKVIRDYINNFKEFEDKN